MKTVLVLLLGLTTTLAYADGVSMVCDGKTQAPRDKIVSGKVNVLVSGTIAPHSTPPFFEDGYSYGVSFADTSLGDLSCGRPVADIKCSLQNSYYSAPFSVYEACEVGAFDTRGLPHEKFSSRLTISGDHGFFYCAAHDSEPAVYVHMELSNCHVK